MMHAQVKAVLYRCLVLEALAEVLPDSALCTHCYQVAPIATRRRPSLSGGLACMYMMDVLLPSSILPAMQRTC